MGLLIAALISLQAQTQRFDQFTFAPPAGYSLAEQRSEVMAYAKIDAQKRFYCQILVYRSQPTTGTPEGDFQKEWKEAVEVSFRPKAKPAASAFAFPNAAQSYFGLSATTDSNGKPALTSLWVVRFPARYVGVVFNGPSEEAVAACSGDAVKLAGSIQMSGAAPAPVAPPAPAPAAAPAGSVVGVWELVVPTRSSVRYNSTTRGYDYDRFATMRQFRNVHQFRFEGNGTYVYDRTGYDWDKNQRFRILERGTYKVVGGAIQFQPREISEGRSPAGEQPALTPRATPAAHSRNFRMTAAGLQLQAGNGWDSYAAVR